MTPIHAYGWRPQLPDVRDLRLSLAAPTVPLPDRVDLAPLFPPCYDQGRLSSCTANALAAVVQYEQRRQKLTDFMPSRLFVYYNERVIEGTTTSDSGAMLRDGIKTLAAQGVCREELWPYDPAQFAVKPNDVAYQRAVIHKAVRYQAVPQDLHTLKSVIVGGQPIVFGFSVYDAFESDTVAKSGVLGMPSPAESLIGGHAVVLVGYDDATQTFKIRNSWGTDFGKQGYFEMPYPYVASPSLASDFWQIDLLGAA